MWSKFANVTPALEVLIVDGLSTYVRRTQNPVVPVQIL